MAAVTVITGVHFNRDAVIEMYIAPMDGDRWMVGISQDCTIFGTAGQLRSVAQQILDQVPEVRADIVAAAAAEAAAMVAGEQV